MTLTESDYKVVIGENGYKAISQVSQENVHTAEREAQDQGKKVFHGTVSFK